MAVTMETSVLRTSTERCTGSRSCILFGFFSLVPVCCHSFKSDTMESPDIDLSKLTVTNYNVILIPVEGAAGFRV